MNFNDISNRIAQSQSADFGQVFNDTIDLFKKTWTQGFIYLLFIFGIGVLFISPIILLQIGMQAIDINYYAGLSTFAVISLIVLSIFVISVIITVINGLTGGLYLVYKKADHNESYSTNDFFTLLKKDTILKTYKLSLAEIGIAILAILMCYFPIIYVMIPLRFAVVLYAYNDGLSTKEIIKLAFQIGNKNWFVAFGLYLLTGIISNLGIFLCGIGYLFTYSLIFIPFYFIYKDAIGFDETTEIDTIGIEEGF